MKITTGLATTAAMLGLGLFLFFRDPEVAPKKPKPRRRQLPPLPAREPLRNLRGDPAPPISGPRPLVPFEFLVRDESNALMAKREYDGYLDGSLPLEIYPFEWFAREDQVILKVGPGKWVEVDEHPISLLSLLGIPAPSWLSVGLVASGVALAVAPEAIAAIGIEGALVEGTLSALEMARFAHKITAVVLRARESTAAGVAELAVQLFSIPGAGPTLGDIVTDQLQQAGMRVIIRNAVGLVTDPEPNN